MYILYTVISFLIIISAITYARIEEFKDNYILHKMHRDYMQKSQYTIFNQIQQSIYENKSSKYNPKNKEKEKKKELENQSQVYNSSADTVAEGDEKEKEKRENLNSALDIGIFFKSNESDPKYLQSLNLLKKLIIINYADFEFYKEMREKVDDFDNVFLQKIIDAIKNFDDKVKKSLLKRDLAEIKLPEQDLQYVWCRIIRGTKSVNTPEESGYYPVGRFLTITGGEKAYKPISVYLARPPLLLAIFEDPSLVQAIIECRNRIHKEGIKRPEGKSTLENICKNRIPADISPELLSFEISGTDPTKYQ